MDGDQRQGETRGVIRRVFTDLRSGLSSSQSANTVPAAPVMPPARMLPAGTIRTGTSLSLPMPAGTTRLGPSEIVTVMPPALPATQPAAVYRTAGKVVTVPSPLSPSHIPASQPMATSRIASGVVVPVTVRSAPLRQPAAATQTAPSPAVTAAVVSLPPIQERFTEATSSTSSRSLHMLPGDTLTDGSYLELFEDAYTPQGQPWFSAEYLLWRITSGATPPLVATGNPADAFPGALGQPGTRVLFGGNNAMDYGGISGMRLGTGIWLGPRALWGLEGSGFFFEHAVLGIAAASDQAGNPPLFVPFFRSELGRPGSFTISTPVLLNPVPQPGSLLGGVSVDCNTRFWGAEGNIVRNLLRTDNCSIDFLLGFRYLDLSDALTLGGNSLQDPVTGIQGGFFDRFETSNQLYAAQLGGRFSYQGERLSLDFLPKLALGSNREIVNVTGAFTQTGAVLGPLQGTFPGGIFTQSTNLGRRSADQFAVVPQLQAKIGYNLRPNIRATVGYDFLYWSQVIRAGNQIDPAVNVSQSVPLGVGTLIGPASPAPIFDRTDFIAHGVSFGLELRY